MNDDFNKLDDWMMNATRTERETRVPEKDLQAFHDSVIQKIMARQHHGFDFPYMALGMVGVLSLLVIFGAVFYINTVKVEKEEVAVAPSSLSSSPQVFGGDLNSNVSNAGSPTEAFGDDEKNEERVEVAKVVELPALTEATLIDEIEALKELGVWTEEDEQEAGIPVEVTFADLQIGFNAQPSMPAAGA